MEDWPFEARVRVDCSNPKVVRLDKQGNSIFHDGMEISFYFDINEDIVARRKVIAFKGDTLTMDSELPQGVLRDGLQCLLSARIPPVEIRQYQAVDAMTTIQRLYEDIVVEGQPRSREWRLDTLSVPGIQLSDESSLEDLGAAWAQQRAFLEELKARAHELNVIGKENRQTLDRFHKLQKTIMTMVMIYEAVYSEKKLEITMTSATASLTETYVQPWWYTPENVNGEARNDMVQLFEFLLAQAYRENIRKRGDVIYEEVTVPCRVWKPTKDVKCVMCARPAAFGNTRRSVCAEHISAACCNDFRRKPDHYEYVKDKNGNPTSTVSRVVRGDFYEDESEVKLVRTKAWRPRLEKNDRPLTIQQWINKTINRGTHFELWCKMCSNYGANLSNAERFMKNTYDSAFKSVDVSNQFLSFKNGILDMAYCTYVDNKPTYGIRFYEYGANDFDKDVCTMNFVDDVFRPEWVHEDLEQMQIPGYDDILTYQKYDKDMQRMLDAMLGRLLFPVNKYDRWEKLTVIYGEGGSGKSTIANMIIRVIGHENVGLIASNCEEQYALANVVDKNVWICLELTLGFRLATGVLLSMVTGEHVVVAEKFKTAYQVQWKLNGLLIGNTLPILWAHDAGGALARRVLPFFFAERPSNQNTYLSDVFHRNIGKFVARILRRYHTLAAEKHNLPNSDLPPALRAYMDEFEEKTNVLSKFFNKDSGAPFEIAPPEVLKEIYEELVKQKLLQRVDAERMLNTLASKGGAVHRDGGAENLDALPVGIPPRASVQSVHLNMRAQGSLETLEEWSVPHKEFARAFKDWTAREAPKTTFDINDRATRQSTARKHGLVVQSHVMHADGLKTKDMHWYGIKQRLGND